MKSPAYIKRLLLIALLLETVCITYILKFPTWVPVASVIYFVSGITIALLFVGLPPATLRLSVFLQASQVSGWYKLLLLACMAIALYHFTNAWIINSPLSIQDADMLPIMKVMAERLLRGQWGHLYDPIPEIWGGIQPIYLPAMWLPFTIAVAGNFDMRWITTAGIFFSFSFFLAILDPFKKVILNILLLLCAYMLLRWLLTEEVHNLIRLSEEGVVIFFYSLLVVALLSGNYFFIGCAAALCVLSRYTLAGWLPAMLFYFLFIRKNKKQFLAFVISGLITALLLLPFGWKAIQIFVTLPSLYIDHANRVWIDHPEFFYESMGVAKFFGPIRTILLHRLLISTAFGFPLLFMLTCFIWERCKKTRLSNIPLACLKLSIVVVYNFVDVPYLYLFYTSSFVSLLSIGYFLLADDKKVSTTGFH